MSPPPRITHFGKMSDVSNDFDRAVNFLQGAECPPPVRNPILWYQLAAAFLISAVFIACKPQASSGDLANLRQRIATVESSSVPLALLPETADADLWPTVANLHGTILKAYPGKVGGKPLKDLFRE